MREKVKRILDLVRTGKLTLEDAAPLLAALNPRLALAGADRELVDSLLARGELDTAQIAEHLLLLRGVRDLPPPPPPPRPPRVVMGGRDLPLDMEGLMNRVTSAVGRVGGVMGAAEENGSGVPAPHSGSARILRVQVESCDGDEYSANLPVSLSAHLHKLIPPHGIRALERAGLSIEALHLLIEAGPPPGDLIQAEDSDGNSVRLTLK